MERRIQVVSERERRGFMISRSFAVVALLLAGATLAQAQPKPTIKGCSGAVQHGNAIACTGSGFGTKPTAAPVCFDDFQSVAPNATISTSRACSWTNPDSNDTNPIASTTVVRDGTPFTKNMRSQWNNGGVSGNAASSVALLGQRFVKFQIDAWLYMDTSGLTELWKNVKPFRLHSAGFNAPSYNLGVVESGRQPKSSSSSFYPAQLDGVGDECGSAMGDAGGFWYNHWRHFKALVDAGSGNGAGNGSVIFLIEGSRGANCSRIQTTAPGQTHWPEIVVGNYIRGGDWSGTARHYWESVYIDNAWARVEISNKSSYDSASHREMCIPSSWSNTSVTCRINRGSFQPGESVYVHVCTNENRCSAGFGPLKVAKD
jgi:hypothetical protein